MKKKADNKRSVSLQKHLTELRQRLLNSLLVIFSTFIACWFFSEQILDVLRHPFEPFLKSTRGGLIFTAPMDQFLAHMQVSLFSAVLFSSPYWLAQVWCFISPGLYKKERKVFIFFCLMGTVLFLFGVCFAYFVVFPFVFSILMNFGSGIDQPFITIKHYLSFVLRFTLILGLVFEMPLILVLLCKSGIISSGFLRKYRRQAVLFLSVLAAFITPPDVLSLFLLLLPLVGLYELSIWLTCFLKK